MSSIVETDRLLRQVWDEAIAPALVLLPPKMSSPQAWVQMFAMGLQESKLVERRQILSGGGPGPATGMWQFEEGGGVKGVLAHALTADLARSVCAARGVRPDRREVWRALEVDDVLAAAFARLLLWTDRPPLPEHRDVEGAWRLYVRTWRPGRPHRQTWNAHHARARRFVYGE